MEIIELQTWQEFENRIEGLRKQHPKASEFLFRGQSNAGWSLMSTLERAQMRTDCSFLEYYRLIARVRPQVQAFTGRVWDIPEDGEYQDWLIKNSSMMPSNFACLPYMTHLRHYGFPSPMMDWTVSPHIAAYFAFQHATTVGRVAIFVFVERTQYGKGYSSGHPEIWELGHYLDTDKRHFLQQCRYTISIMKRELEWHYASHEAPFAHSREDQDLLWKITLPVSERLKVLAMLDRLNLNGYSLFGSVESLMETMAFRELHLPEYQEAMKNADAKEPG